MQTITVKRNAQRTATLQEWMTVKGKFESWLHAKNEFHSTISGFHVTNGMVFRIDAFVTLLVIVAVTAEPMPIVAVVAVIAALFTSKGFNSYADKEGGEE